MSSGSGTGTPISSALTLYATVAQIKARAFPAGLSDTTDDTVFSDVLEGVSRLIDNYTGRRFYTAGDETRTFWARYSYREVFIDDLISITSLKTDLDGDRTYETTWATTDYDLLPENAALDNLPWTRVVCAPYSTQAFPIHRKGVQIVGKFGFLVVPAEIREACLLQGQRLFERGKAIFGVVGSAEMGQMLMIAKLDPDVKLLLQGWIKENY